MFSEKIFECFSLKHLNQREDLDMTKVKSTEDFLKCDLSVFSEREIVATIVNSKTFSNEEGELIKVWATILKSKKLFEIAEGSSLTDTEFVVKVKNFVYSGQLMCWIPSVSWKYALISSNNSHNPQVKNFYEGVVLAMAKNGALTIKLIERFDSIRINWNYADMNGETILMHLCNNKPNISVLACLLSKGIDLSVTDKEGYTVFTRLCFSRIVTFDLIKLFVDNGANIDFQDEYRRTSFSHICFNEAVTLEMIQLFFDRSADISIQTIWGQTTFMGLCGNKVVTLEMIELFINNGVDINVQDVTNCTAFMRLCGNEAITIEMVRLFLSKGVDIDVRNKYGATALQFYRSTGGKDCEILRLLTIKRVPSSIAGKNAKYGV